MVLLYATGADDHIPAASSEERNVVSRLTVKQMLSNVHTVRCTDYTQLLALINNIRLSVLCFEAFNWLSIFEIGM